MEESSKVLGAKVKAKRAVPNCCTEKRANKKTCRVVNVSLISRLNLPTIEIGIVSFETDGFATAMPPTALVTETAGVKTPSAIVRLEIVSDISTKPY